jgi:hypothetical protein
MPVPDDYIPQPGYPGPFPPDLGSFQPLNENLTEISDLTTDAFGRGLLPQTSAVNVRSYIGAGESGFDGAFSSLTGIPTTIAGYGITNAQPLDADLTTISGLTATTDNFLQSKAGAWASRTVAQVKTDLSLSGSNTGDQVSIVGITGTLAEFNTALTGADFATGGGTASGTNTGDVTLAGENYLTISAQVITANAVNLSGTHVTGTLAAGRFPALTGDVTTIAGALASTIAANAVSLAKMSQVATGTILGRVTAATGNVEALTGTQATTLLDTFTSSLKGLTPLSGGGTSNFLRADGTWQTPAGTAGITALTGDVTATGPGSVAATISASAVTLAKMADVATASVFYRKTSGTGAPEVNTLATLKTDLGLTGTNSGDQTITLTGDVTGSGTGSFATTLATVATAGTTGGSTAIPVVTIDVKGRVTGITTAAVIAPANTLTGATLASVVTASSLTSFGAGIALGTPASGIATNLTGTASGLTAGNVTTNANLTGVVTSIGNATAIADAALAIAKTSGLQSALDAKQPLDATLTALANLTIAADSLAIGTGADAFTQTTFAANTLPARASTGSLVAKPITDFGLSLIDDAAASNARTTLGLGSMSLLSTTAATAITMASAQPITISSGGITITNWGDWFGNTSTTARLAITSAAGPTLYSAGNVDVLHTNGSGQIMIGTTLTTSLAQLFVNALSSAIPVSIFRGAASHSANLTEWQNSSGTVLSVVTAAGNVGIGTTSPNTKLEVNGTFRSGNANDTYMTYDSAADNITLRKGSYYTSFGFDDANGFIPTIGFSGGPSQLIIKAGSLYVKPTAAAGLVNAIKLENTTGTSNVSATGISLRAGGNVAKGLIAFTNQTVWGVGDFTFGINNSANNTEVGLADARMTMQGSTGNVGIGTTAPDANAILDVTSTTKAFMPPRMTTTQKNAIASPTAGMVVYDSTLNKLCVRAASAWETVTSV